MLTIEFEPPKESEPCECCGGRTTVLTRFVNRDDEAYAIYFARFSNNHPERVVVATISIGEWGESASSDQRVAFAFEIRAIESECQVGLIDSDRSPWRDSTFIGRTLNRSEALAHPAIQDVFHITDHIVVEDILIRDTYTIIWVI